MLENFNYKEEDTKLTSMLYLYPKHITYLNDDWLQALKMVVNKINQDKTDLSKTATPHDENPEQVLERLNQVIIHNENLRKNKPKI